MFESMKISKCKKYLAKLKKQKKLINSKLEAAEESAGCSGCELYNRGSITNYIDRYAKCAKCKGHNKCKELASRLDAICLETDSYIENEYANMVFNVYNSKRPMLYEVYDKKMVSWEEAFINDFDKIPKTLRHSLVGLIEGEGRYKFK